MKLKLQYFGWLIWKDPDVGKDWRQEEKGTTEDEMVGWHHLLNGHGFGWTPGVGDGQGGLACCSSWGRKESDTTEQLNWIPYTSLAPPLFLLPTDNHYFVCYTCESVSVLLYTFIVFLFRFYVSLIEYLSFSVWIILLSIVLFRFTHVVANGRILFFLWLSDILLCVYLNTERDYLVYF